MKHLFKPAVIKSVIYVLFLLLAVKIFWFVIELAFLPVEDIEYTKRAGTKSLYYRTRFASQKKAGKVFRKKEPVSDIRNIRLLAIYHSPRQVVITVSKKGKTSVLVRGDQIDGYVLDDATATEAIFVKNGKKYRIRLYEPKGAGKARQSVRFVPSGGPKASGTSSGGIKEEGGRVVVEKNLLHHYTKHMDDIWKNIGIKEIKDGNQIKGFKVNFVKRGSDFAKLGLKRGDVIKAINGQELDSYNAAFDIYRNIDSMEDLTLTIKRGNEEMELEYEIH